MLFAAGCGPSHQGDPNYVYINPSRAAYYPQDCSAAPRDGQLYEKAKVEAQGYRLAEACSDDPQPSTADLKPVAPPPAAPSPVPETAAGAEEEAPALRLVHPSREISRRSAQAENALPKTGVLRWGNRDYEKRE